MRFKGVEAPKQRLLDPFSYQVPLRDFIMSHEDKVYSVELLANYWCNGLTPLPKTIFGLMLET